MGQINLRALPIVLLLGATFGIGSVATAAEEPSRPGPNAQRNAYFGDLHVHTSYSFDAYIFNVRATPDDAYRYAKGETIKHAAGFDVRLTDAPLDFLAVTDHAEYLGILPAMNDPQQPLSKVPYAPQLFSTNRAAITAAFRRIADSVGSGKMLEELRDPAVTKSAWSHIVESAERHNVPGRFTTFIGYEYTSPPNGRNLHRNVIFAGSKTVAVPFTSLDSQNPEDLWAWLEARRVEGIEALAIPHNSNGSDGLMFERTKWNGAPMDSAYASLRMRNEPLVEVTQVKGTSETHPMLSPTDEWANFEIMDWYIGSAVKVTKFAGGYVRDAYRGGLEMQAKSGFNPYKFGLIGSSDTHNAAGPYEENHYFSKVGIMDATGELRGSVLPSGLEEWQGYEPPANVARYSTWGASGLTGVWAEENTRASIFAALRRKETFGTTGPRMKVRFFGGYGLRENMLSSQNALAGAYANGVPMGSDLRARAGTSPDFLVWAQRDVHSAPLQRAQIVKAWTDKGGTSHEKVFDVACSDGLKVDAKTHRCPDNGARVNVADCSFSPDKGAAELRAAWKDPEFSREQHALYYVRVLENPTCRWSTWDAIRAKRPLNPKLQATLQERAYSSPIWFLPAQ